MKISVITVCYNSESYIRDCIESVINQSYSNLEYIIVDGKSTDGTLKIIENYKYYIHKLISESDTGIYNAMNKGILCATGDIIGILNSDDYFADNKIIERIVQAFQQEKAIDAIYGDVQFVKPNNLDKVVRYYSSKKFTPFKFRYGFMPAHPSFYVKHEWFEKLGYYREDYQIAADYELLIRFLYKQKLKCKYIEMPFVSMRTGGISNKSFKSNYILNKEIIRACEENGIKTNLFNVYSKYFIKIFELFRKN